MRYDNTVLDVCTSKQPGLLEGSEPRILARTIRPSQWSPGTMAPTLQGAGRFMKSSMLAIGGRCQGRALQKDCRSRVTQCGNDCNPNHPRGPKLLLHTVITTDRALCKASRRRQAQLRNHKSCRPRLAVHFLNATTHTWEGVFTLPRHRITAIRMSKQRESGCGPESPQHWIIANGRHREGSLSHRGRAIAI